MATGIGGENSECVVHFPGNRGVEALVDTKSHHKTVIEQRARLWVSLEPAKQPEKGIADRYLLNLSSSSSSDCGSSTTTSRPATTRGYDDAQRPQSASSQHHRTCYTRFTSLSKYERAKSQKRKVRHIKFNY